MLQDDDHAYVVTEVCHGGDLEQFLQVGVLAVCCCCVLLQLMQCRLPTARLIDQVTC